MPNQNINRIKFNLPNPKQSNINIYKLLPQLDQLLDDNEDEYILPPINTAIWGKGFACMVGVKWADIC